MISMITFGRFILNDENDSDRCDDDGLLDDKISRRQRRRSARGSGCNEQPSFDDKRNDDGAIDEAFLLPITQLFHQAFHVSGIIIKTSTKEIAIENTQH
jgi:hypothetical protein